MSASPHDALAALADELVRARSVNETVERVTSFSARAFGTGHAGVTLLQDRATRFPPAGPTDTLVRQADELQDVLSEGPCVDAATHGRSVLCNDIGQDLRWPSWGPRVIRLGFDSILSSALQGGGRRLGALNVYGPAGHRFTAEDVELGRAVAYQASVALRLSEEIEGLRSALDTRTLIGQAQGVLIERYAVDADRAFSILRRFSQDQNTRLVEIARTIVTEAGNPPPQES